MRVKTFNIIAIVCVSALFFSCTPSEKTATSKKKTALSKSSSLTDRYTYAKQLYDAGNYRKAASAFEDIQSYMKGRENFGEMTFQMAYSYYYSKDFFMAAAVFQNFTRLFPTDAKVEEAFYMSALCTMLDAPYYKLDQTQAKEAIKLFQLFTNYYPKSNRVVEANTNIDLLREKIGKKYFELADNYYKRGAYNSADIAYKNVIKEYSETSYREKAMYKDVKALYKYAANSVAARQVERFKSAIVAYENFERSYPESQYIADAKKYNDLSIKFLTKNNIAL